MNPILVANAAKGAKKVFSNKYVLIIVLGALSIWLLKGGVRKLIRKYRESKFDKNETQDVNQIAQQYRSASNPSGVSWMIDWDGSDEDQLEKLGYQTKGNFRAIADAYKLKFNETLTDRVRAELSADEFQNWHNIVT